MTLERCTMPEFSVIGREGDTRMGAGFFKKLWQDANSRFSEVSALAARDSNGALLGMWGLMTDRSRRFLPWENDFTDGLYLAGVQCANDALPPEGWTKWTAPAAEYVFVKNDSPDAFQNGLKALHESGEQLVGAAYDFCCPQTGEEYIFFPVKKL